MIEQPNFPLPITFFTIFIYLSQCILTRFGAHRLNDSTAMTGTTQPCSFTCSCTDCSASCPPVPNPPVAVEPTVTIFGLSLSALTFGTALGGIIFAIVIVLLGVVLICTKPDYDDGERQALLKVREEEEQETAAKMRKSKSILGFLNRVNRQYAFPPKESPVVYLQLTN